MPIESWNPDMDYAVSLEASLPETKTFIRNFNFRRLREILANLAARTQNDPSQLNFIPPDKIYCATSFSDHYDHVPYNGVYHTDIKSITFSESIFQYNLPEEQKLSNAIQTLIHEEVHAATHKETKAQSVGYSTKKKFTLWNEGVTELITDDVADEYVRSTAQITPDKYHPIHIQSPARRLVAVVREKIAKDAGVTPKVVWEAMIRGAFDNLDMSTLRFRAAFEPVLGVGFFTLLEQAHPEDVDKLIEFIGTGKFERAKMLLSGLSHKDHPDA